MTNTPTASAPDQSSAQTEEVLDRAVNLGCSTDEPTLREMVAHYYRSHSMPDPMTWTDRYVASLTSEVK